MKENRERQEGGTHSQLRRNITKTNINKRENGEKGEEEIRNHPLKTLLRKWKSHIEAKFCPAL
jgi:hypothetical protein